MRGYSNNKIYEYLKEILQYQVSDIHFAEDKPVYVRNSSGDIKPIPSIVLSKDELWGFLHDFLGAEELDRLLDGGEVDASYTIDQFRFRINAYLDRDGIRLALRKISSNPPTLEEIGFDEKIKPFLLRDRGLILVTGSTGSGKSTTLAAAVDYINANKNAHIITLEDPVEYVFENKKSLITQREIGKNSKNWKDAMKYILRQDPDVIMVGEMRDLETISAVLTLVETGHLVLSTLHTNDAVQTISRIIDVFPPHQQEQVAVQLSLSLNTVISQRLLPTVGSKGRVASREVLVNTTAVANNIRERKVPQVYSLMETGFRYGMQTMDQSLAKLVVNGVIDNETAIGKVRSLDNFNSLKLNYKNAGKRFNPID